MDLGTGAFANLRSYVDYDRIGAVVISHMHADHFIDLVPLRYALRYGGRKRRGKMPVYLPPDGTRMLRQLVSAFADEGGEFLSDVYDIKEYDPSKRLKIAASTITFAHTAHYIPAFAMRWENNGSVITYSADTAPDERVVALARDSDVFLCEATLLHGEHEHGMRGHSTAVEAAEMAKAAGVRRLILTHYGDDSTSADLDQPAAAEFSGEIIVADDHHVVDLSP